MKSGASNPSVLGVLLRDVAIAASLCRFDVCVCVCVCGGGGGGGGGGAFGKELPTQCQ